MRSGNSELWIRKYLFRSSHIILTIWLTVAGGCQSQTPFSRLTDADGDGYHRSGESPIDCDDDNPNIYPGAEEICDNGVDEDCDGQPNRSQLWYGDGDGDGYGSTSATQWACTPSQGFVAPGGDCDDGDQRFNPGASEAADATDLDCDGKVSFPVNPELGVSDQEAYSPLFGDLRIAIPADSIDLKSVPTQKTAEVSDELIVTVGLANDLQSDPTIWNEQSLDQALLSPFFEFSPDLRFLEPATIQYPFDPLLLEWQPELSCDWLGVWQVDDAGEPIDDALSTVACDLDRATLTVALAHFSAYQVRGQSTVVELEPVYLDQDQPPQAPTVQANSGVAFTRSWRLALVGEPVAAMERAFSVLTGDDGLESVVLVSVDWDPATELYPMTLRAFNRDTQMRQVEVLVYASSGVTQWGTRTGVCPVQRTMCSSNLPRTVGKEVHCSEYCDGSVCYDFDDDQEADIFECMVLDVEPDPAPEDDDGDSYTEAQGDCDDGDPAIYPNASEVCDGADNDCDLRIDDADSDVEGQAPYYPDADGDGYGALSSAGRRCGFPPSGYTGQTGDCDDTTAAANPAQVEVCDGIDNDCNGQTDDGVGSFFFLDSDSDGFGTDTGSVYACSAPPDYVPTAGDCDDTNASIHPGVDEVCDSSNIDENCNDVADDNDPTTTIGSKVRYYYDEDDDGYGSATDSGTLYCDPPTGYVPLGGDCHDENRAYNPGAKEADCEDPNDYNCDGSVAYQDLDGDGFPACAECDDKDAEIRPDADEICDDIDNDCDGLIDDDDPSTSSSGKTVYYQDLDGDGYGNESASAAFCDNPSTSGEAWSIQAGDCDDGAVTVHPGLQETCNLIDDNCDGQTDEGVQTTYYLDGDRDGYGVSTSTAQACSRPDGYSANASDCNDGNASIHPGATESCDGVDQDCDGQVDDGVPTQTWYRDFDGDGYGNAADSIVSCGQESGFVSDGRDCDDASASVNPGASETCNDIDDNCDGQVDEEVTVVYYFDGDNDGYGDSDRSIDACSPPNGYVSNHLDCDDGVSYCTMDCTTDVDSDGLTDCVDTCIDSNGDGLSDAGHPWETCPQSTDCSEYFCDSNLTFQQGGSPPGYGNNAGIRAVALDTTGRIHVLYEQLDGSDYNVYHSLSEDDGQTFREGVRVNSVDNLERSGLDMEVSASGRIHVVWECRTCNNGLIFHQYSDSGGLAWSEENDLAITPSTEWAQDPRIQVDSNGDIYAAFCAGLDPDIKMRVQVVRSTDGGRTWSPPSEADTTSDQDNDPNIAVSNGIVHVTWYDFQTQNIYYSHSSGSWNSFTAPTVVNSSTPGSAHPDSSLAARDGQVLIAWKDRSQDIQGDVFYRVSVSNGSSFTSPAPLPGGVALYYQQSVQTLVTFGGQLVVVWADRRNGIGYDIHMSYSLDAAEEWVGPVQITFGAAEGIDNFPYDVAASTVCNLTIAASITDATTVPTVFVREGLNASPPLEVCP